MLVSVFVGNGLCIWRVPLGWAVGSAKGVFRRICGRFCGIWSNRRGRIARTDSVVLVFGHVMRGVQCDFGPLPSAACRVGLFLAALWGFVSVCLRGRRDCVWHFVGS